MSHSKQTSQYKRCLGTTLGLLATSTLECCSAQSDPRWTAIGAAETFRQGWGYAPAGPTEIVTVVSRGARWAVEYNFSVGRAREEDIVYVDKRTMRVVGESDDVRPASALQLAGPP